MANAALVSSSGAEEVGADAEEDNTGAIGAETDIDSNDGEGSDDDSGSERAEVEAAPPPNNDEALRAQDVRPLDTTHAPEPQHSSHAVSFPFETEAHLPNDANAPKVLRVLGQELGPQARSDDTGDSPTPSEPEYNPFLLGNKLELLPLEEDRAQAWRSNAILVAVTLLLCLLIFWLWMR